MSNPTEKSGLRFDANISLGSILQALVVAGIGAFFFVTSASNKTDNTAANLIRVETSVGSTRDELIKKMDDAQAQNAVRFSDISRQVAGLPDQSAALRQIDARVTRLETTKENRDRQIVDLSATLYQDHADLAAIQKANGVKIGK
jgi:hypothetical protein